MSVSVCFYSDSESEISFILNLFIIITDLQISICPRITPYLLWTHPVFNNSTVKLAPASMQVISKYYCSGIRCHKQPSVYTFVWLTLMKVLISLLMRALSSAFFSLHLWPEYLWKIWMMETIPLSSSDMLSSKVCSRQFRHQMCDLKIFFLFSAWTNTVMFHPSYVHWRFCSSKERNSSWQLPQQRADCLTQATVDTNHGCDRLSCAA